MKNVLLEIKSMIRLDSFGNELSGRGIIRTDSGKILDIEAARQMTEKKLLQTYFPSKIMIATEEMEGHDMPIHVGRPYVKVDGENWSIADLIATPVPYASLGIEEFQPDEKEIVIRTYSFD